MRFDQFRFTLLTVINLVLLSLAPIGLSQDSAQEIMNAALQEIRSGNSEKAEQLLSQAIKQDPKLASAYYYRGRQLFKLNRIAESVTDFDQYAKLNPRVESSQWERGIACYYAGDFKKGAKQFELYQTYHDSDVENSVWRYLCIAKSVDVATARKTMLEIKGDSRVPMMEIYKMFQGKIEPSQVLETAQSDKVGKEALNQQLFYAHLYLGLYFDAEGKPELAEKHIRLAVDHRIGHYMWDVAAIHLKQIEREQKQEK